MNAPSCRIAAGLGFSALPNRASPLTAVPAGGHAVPEGQDPLHAARRGRPLERSGAPTCRSRSPSQGRGVAGQPQPSCTRPAAFLS